MQSMVRPLMLAAVFGVVLSGCGAPNVRDGTVSPDRLIGTGAPTPPRSSASATATVATTAPIPQYGGPPESAKGTVFTLLADNRLMAVHAQDGMVIAERVLAPRPVRSPGRSTGHFLARSKDGARLFVLLTDDLSALNQLAVVDIATVEVRATYPLTVSGDSYRSIAVGPGTGRLYLFGNRGGDAIVTILDPASGAALAIWSAKAGGHSWIVYQGAVSDDERQLFISYHGPDTTGIDWFAVTDGGLQRCQVAVRPNFGCLPTHGGFAVAGDGLFAATGTNIILNVDENGTIRYGLDTFLTGNHLMEFAVDGQTGQLYAVGSCGYTGGFSAIDLRSGGSPAEMTKDGVRLRSTPVPPQVLVRGGESARPGTLVPCGERLALGANALVVVGKTEKPVAAPDVPGSLLFLNGRTGQTIETVATPSEPIDVLVIDG